MPKKLFSGVVVGLLASALVITFAVTREQPTTTQAEAFARLCWGRSASAVGAKQRVPYPQLGRLLSNPRSNASAFLVVRGRVTHARAGQALLSNGQEVAFGDEHANQRYAHLEVYIREVISGQPIRRDIVVPVPLPTGPQVDAIKVLDGFKDLEGLDAVWFLRHPGIMDDPLPPVFYQLFLGSSLIARIGPDGRLSLPCPAAEYGPEVLAGTPTLAALRAAAQAKPIRHYTPRTTPPPVPRVDIRPFLKAQPRSAKPSSEGAVDVGAVTETPNEVLDYWTPERMAAAKGA